MMTFRRGRTKYTAIVIVMLLVAGSVQAAVVNFNPVPWSPTNNYIVRNGTEQNQPLPSTQPGNPSYTYIEDLYLNNSVAHSGSSSTESQFLQHVYAYSLADTNNDYNVRNVAGNSKTYIFGDGDSSSGRPEKIIVDDGVEFGSSFIMVSDEDDMRGMLAMLDITVTREFEKNTKKKGVVTIEKNLRRGRIFVVGNKKGAVKFKAKGISLKSISAIGNEYESVPVDYENGVKISKHDLKRILIEGERFEITFDDMVLPYKFKTFAGFEETINVELTSEVVTQGAGQGAEILVNPTNGQPMVPTMHNQSVVPEPATLVMLLGGGLLGLRRKQ